MNDREICDLINDTYFRKLSAMPGDFVSIADLRDHTDPAGVYPDELAATLIRLYQDQKVNLVPASNQQILTGRERHAAILCGGERKHLVSIGEAS